MLLVSSITKETETNGQMSQEVEDALKRAKELKEERRKSLDYFEDNYEESKLTEEEIDLSKIYSREDILSHARLIWGIIDGDSRKEARYRLPLTTNALSRHFSGSDDNVYYGKYTKGVSIEVTFVGLDYSSTDTGYTANIIADVTYQGENETSKTVTSLLIIKYNGLSIESWDY